MKNKQISKYNFSIEYIKEIRKALIDDSAGNCQCTMTDLDLAINMLTELIDLKTFIGVSIK